jgi:methyltransferase-like protein
MFETPDGITLASRDPIVKTAMVCLGKNWPRTMPFMELLSEARAMLKAHGVENQVKDDITALSQALLTFYASASTALLEVTLQPSKFVAEPSERPEAWPLARLQAAAQSRVTNLRHESMYLGEFERHLLRLLDGAHTRKQMAAQLTELVTQGELTVEKDGQPVLDAAQVRDMVAQAVETQLQTIARSALLVR